jgi:hypothetical protein
MGIAVLINWRNDALFINRQCGLNLRVYNNLLIIFVKFFCSLLFARLFGAPIDNVL